MKPRRWFVVGSLHRHSWKWGLFTLFSIAWNFDLMLKSPRYVEITALNFVLTIQEKP